jgi:hypothetical protein
MICVIVQCLTFIFLSLAVCSCSHRVSITTHDLFFLNTSPSSISAQFHVNMTVEAQHFSVSFYQSSPGPYVFINTTDQVLVFGGSISACTPGTPCIDVQFSAFIGISVRCFDQMHVSHAKIHPTHLSKRFLSLLVNS